jgi:hypothetical protein
VHTRADQQERSEHARGEQAEQRAAGPIAGLHPAEQHGAGDATDATEEDPDQRAEVRTHVRGDDAEHGDGEARADEAEDRAGDDEGAQHRAGPRHEKRNADEDDADVILLPLPKAAFEGIAMFVFIEDHTRADIRIRPTSGATLVGYPYGFSDTKNRLPVWKTGHVASEPQVDFQGNPAFLVDVSAFPGMSGSPVLAVANGVYEDEREVMRTGKVLRLLGVFSAMPVMRSQTPGQSDISLQLGYVWKASLIAELARAYRPR